MKCWHMSGAGNDFMVIDGRGLTPDYETLSRRLCALTNADGFMAVDYSQTADFKLHFYNSDGSRGEMCGNGSRCICKFAYDNGIAGDTMVIEADAGPVPGWRLSENRYRVQLNLPTTIDLQRTPGAAYVELGNPGLPHGVVELPDLEFSDQPALLERAKQLRFCPDFPKGANINFFTVTGENQVRILTYERGVEDYTLACGTGCGSTAAVLWTTNRLPGGRLTLENQGGTLEVTITGTDRIEKLELEGPAEVLKVYDIDIV